MKNQNKYSTVCLGLAGVACIASAAVSHADITVINDLAAPTYLTGTGTPYLSQEFGSTVNGQIDNVGVYMTLLSGITATVSIYNEGTSSTPSVPTGSGTTLGSFSSTSASAAVYNLSGGNLSSYGLVAGNYYDLLVHFSGAAGPNLTGSGLEVATYSAGNNSGTGGFFLVSGVTGGSTANPSGWGNAGPNFEAQEAVSVAPVPEIPMNPVMIGAAGLFIGWRSWRTVRAARA